MIKISINNEVKKLDKEMILSDFLQIWEQLQDVENPYAVAINGEFVPRQRYEHVSLHNGDTVDIVSPVGGG